MGKYDWKVFRTVEIGGYSNINSLMRAMQSREPSVYFDEMCQAYLLNRRGVLSREIKQVQLVVLTTKDTGDARFNYIGKDMLEVVYKPVNFGLSYCHPEVALRLRLGYVDQPYKEVLTVITKPYRNWLGMVCLFEVVKWGKVDSLSFTYGPSLHLALFALPDS